MSTMGSGAACSGRAEIAEAWSARWKALARRYRTMLAVHRDRDIPALAAARAELSRLASENHPLSRRLAAVERERDAWGGKASTAAAEAASFKRQRNEAQAWVARLLRRYETPS